jgi:chromosome segregation ATPase
MAPLLIAGSMVALTSCSDGKTSSLQAQIDSLNSLVENQAQELDYSQSCLSLITESIDSLAMADSTIIRVTTNREGTMTKESIRQDLDGYKTVLQHQRERLGQLEQQLLSNGREMAKMANVISYLNKQIEAKDAQIQELQNMLEQNNFDIAQLQAKVTQLYNSNSALESTVSSQQEAISVAQEMLNEAYYIIGTSKELKAAGVLSGKLLGKSKVNANNINPELFNKVDIRQVKSIHFDSEKPTIKSQHPSDSYRIVPNKKDKSAEIQIIDELDFWSITHYLIIQK